MNPIEMLRTLVEGLAEGERVKKFGYGYREKAEGQAIENRKGELELADLPQSQKERHATTQIALAAEAERKAQDEADLLAHPGAGSVAALKAKRDQEMRDLKTSQTNAETAAQMAATEGAKQRLPGTAPDLSTEAYDYLGVKNSSDAGPLPPPNNASIDILKDKRQEESRVRAAAAGRQASFGSPMAGNTVQDVADRYVSGELTIEGARGSLGGVKGMQVNGPAFWAAVGDRRGFSPQIRKDLGGIQTTRNIVNQMEELMNNIINSTDPAERVKNTVLLQQFGQTTGTLLSRGFGERGVVTDKDVARATGLVPGWKAANFAPEYAARELALLREVLDRNEKGLVEANVSVRDRQGNIIPSGGGTSGAVEEYVRDPVTKKLVLKPRGQ